MRILLIEDEEKIANFIEEGLKKNIILSMWRTTAKERSVQKLYTFFKIIRKCVFSKAASKLARLENII